MCTYFSNWSSEPLPTTAAITKIKQNPNYKTRQLDSSTQTKVYARNCKFVAEVLNINR